MEISAIRMDYSPLYLPIKMLVFAVSVILDAGDTKSFVNCLIVE